MTQQETIPEPRFNTQRRILVAIIALVVVGILLAVVNAAIKTHKTMHQSYAGITKLDIKVGNGTLHLVNSAGNAVDVERKVDYLLIGPSLTQKVEGNTLVVQQNCSGIHIGECDATYTIAVPNQTNTTIKSSAGSVTIEGLQGSITTQTSGGKVELNQTSGPVEVNTDSGAVTAKDISSSTVQAFSKGGKVQLDFAAAPMKVNATSNDGDIAIQVPKGNLAYKVDAGSINAKSTVDVKNETSSPRSISAHSTNGKVTVETD